MPPIRTILYPTDFSPPAATAFPVACALARDYGARLVALYVKPPDVLYGDGFVLPPDPASVRKELLAQLYGLQAPDPAVQITYVLEEGDPTAAILEKARTVRCDLIVMGTHGRTGVGRLLLGSVAEAVLRHAPCPVLTVRASLAQGKPAEPAAPGAVMKS
jgi:nucleotide-binding universal stress UspA family protein